MKQDDKHIYISIYLYNKGFIPAGVVTFNSELGYAGFSYFTNYMDADLPPLNPSTLNYRENFQRHFVVPSSNKHLLDRTFWEMLPQQSDWGNQILISRFPEYAYMSNAEKLHFLGNRTVGGLSSYVKSIANEESIKGLDWLEKVHTESVDFFMRNSHSISNIRAITPMTSYGGARPKCMYEDENGDFWIAKFNLPSDPYDMALVEKVAMDMAEASGLNIAESKVITLESGENVFLSKRFDRNKDQRFHSLSLFALAPGNDLQKRNAFAPGNPGSYLATLIKRYSDFKNIDTAHLVTKLLIDLSINNTDNHLRNLRVILNKDNKWELSPIYDIICNPFSQPHTYNPAGLKLDDLYLENPDLAHQMGKELGIKEEFIKQKISSISDVVNNWEYYCDRVGMSLQDKLKVGNAVSLGTKRKEYERKIQIQQKNTVENLPKPKPKV